MFNKKVFSIRFHGYGGQGVKSMASVLAKAVIGNEMFAQAFPEFGPERRGAPVKAYARFSYETILSRGAIEKPDIVVFMSENLLGMEENLEGVNPKTLLIVNSQLEPNELKKKYSLIPEYRMIKTIDLKNKLLDFDNQVHPSVLVLGEIVKLTEVVPIQQLKNVLREVFLGKIGEKKMILTEKALEEIYYNL